MPYTLAEAHACSYQTFDDTGYDASFYPPIVVT
jgi:hypothetical protein